MKHRLVIVKWLDSCSTRGWVGVDEAPDSPSVVTSVGWIIREDHKSITLVSHIAAQEDGGPDSQYEGLMVIPMMAIVHHQVIRKARV